jgi:type IV secretion system protein VirB6
VLIQEFNDKAGTMVSTVLQGNFMTTIFWISLLAVVFFAIGNVLFLLAAMLVVLVTKGFGSFLIAIGPIFILFLLFESTRQWFVNWLGSMFGLIVLAWLSFFLLGFSLVMQDKILAAITMNLGSVNVLTQSLVYVVLCGVFAVVLWSAPAFVHGLTGGAAAQMGVQMASQIYQYLRPAKQPPKPNPSAGGNTASRGFAYRAGSAVGNLTGVQWGFQRLAAVGRGRNP